MVHLGPMTAAFTQSVGSFLGWGPTFTSGLACTVMFLKLIVGNSVLPTRPSGRGSGAQQRRPSRKRLTVLAPAPKFSTTATIWSRAKRSPLASRHAHESVLLLMCCIMPWYFDYLTCLDYSVLLLL